MKASLYVNYTTRSLLRGGQRTILALFCIAVGVMAIVALQSVGEMIAHSFTGNVRDANGGDIAISSYAPDITQDDLTFFADLKKQGTITGYTPVLAENGALSATTAAVDRFALRAVDPQTYPVVTPPVFVSPGDGRVATLLKGNQVIVDQAFADQYHKNVGDRFDVHITTTGQGAIVLHAQLAGVVADSGVFANAKNVMLIDEAGIRAAAPTVVLNY
ncbi:MAG TPA: ABC transporter permease, partial [Ktedonobacteraceae bacterium]|nr:ABC transporter permease [Ktedonobacteraceae bacterium]